MTRFNRDFSERLERDLNQISDRATPSSPTAWETIQQRIDEQDSRAASGTERTMEVIMLDPETNKYSKRPRTGMLVAASLAAITLIGGLIVVANRDGERAPLDRPAPAPTVPVTDPAIAGDPALVDESDLEPDQPGDVSSEPFPTGDEVLGAPVGAVAGQGAPVPAGQIADIGAGYRLQVLSVTGDATTEVLARSESNDSPPAGTRYTLVTVAAGFYGTEDPQERFLANIRAFGADGEQLDRDCGQFTELGGGTPVNLFAGAVVRGDICVVTTPADAEALVIQAFGGSGDDNSFLDAAMTPNDVAEMPTLLGAQRGSTSAEQRQNQYAIGIPAEVGETGWAAMVTGPVVDITDAVMAEDPGNSAPADGFRFIGVPMSMEHAETTDNAPFAANVRAVGNSNVQYGSKCGVVPDELDLFSPVAARSPVVGQLCFVVPTDEVDSMMVYGGRTFADVFFDT